MKQQNMKPLFFSLQREPITRYFIQFPRRTFLHVILISVSVVLSTSSFGQPPPSTKPKPKNIQDQINSVRNRFESAEQAILNANKKKDCDGDGQCDVLEAGSRHCGGPTSYVVVSDTNPKLSEVKAKIIEYTAVQKELNIIDPPSDCTAPPRPVTGRCLKNQCVGVDSK